jgi:hypothetical protein
VSAARSARCEIGTNLALERVDVTRLQVPVEQTAIEVAVATDGLANGIVVDRVARFSIASLKIEIDDFKINR